jgi:hypothetical protein
VRTKWDILQERKAEAERVLARLVAEIKYLEETPFVDAFSEAGRCSKCEKPLPTEKDFAQHFIVPDERLYNLGYCPENERYKQ